MKVISTVIPLNIENIDTDQLIPAQFLKSTSKKGYGKNLFYNWRYKDLQELNTEFELNNPVRKGAQVIIGGNNFGCGSSREHAAWAISDYGIKVVISSQFADIHKGNLYNNGVLPVEVAPQELEVLMNYFLDFPLGEIIVDLKEQIVEVSAINFAATFDIPPFKKKCMLEGVDEIQYLINMKDEIAEFELNNY
ncbi:MAG: 3-isopropylmalate/(R)-2-methylmalate dehydratase small subunit [Flavobacteriales bacterium]|jgi:3-isopropylmalate/(R)-2-methylmalate dehydratase small subunit